MVNVLKLKGKIAEAGLSIPKLASQMDIDKATLYRKLQCGGENLLIKDVDTIARILNLSGEDINDIFFSDKVA